MKTLSDERCRAELIRRVGELRPDSPRQWGRMSAHQMVCHVIDSCRMMTGEMPVSPASGPLQRSVLKWVALYAPLRWPPGILTRPEIDQYASGTRPTDFAADVAMLESVLGSLKTRGAGARWPAHPIFGRMSERAWFRWAYLHTDHHLRQFGA
jgi:hypothetical protein